MTKTAVAASCLAAVLGPAAPARADCAGEVDAVRAQLREAKEEHRREIARIAEKAELDRRGGWEKQCAVARARALLK
jgi:hypothetical protein